MTKERTPQLVYRFTPERRRQIREWMAKHDTTIQAMLEQGLNLLMGEKLHPEQYQEKTGSIEPITGYTLKHLGRLDWARWALILLDSEDAGTLTGLTANIRDFLAGIALEFIDKGGVFDATDPDAINYPREARTARDRFEQFRRELENASKKLR